MRIIVFRLIRFTMLPLLIRETLQRRRVTVIFYHDPSPATIAAHLRVLRRTYSIIPLRQFFEAHRLRTIHALPAKPLVLSFDDGHAGNFQLKPLLEEFQVPVAIFLCSGIVGTGRRFWFNQPPGDDESLKRVPDAERLERLKELGFDETREFAQREALSAREIRELSPLVDFQSHTVSHPVLPFCSPEKAENEIISSKRELEQEYGFDICALSYPNGNYSDREVTLTKEAGYDYALTADAGFNSNETDPLLLKRICIDDNDGIDELMVKACGLWGWITRLTRRRQSELADLPSRRPSTPSCNSSTRSSSLFGSTRSYGACLRRFN